MNTLHERKVARCGRARGLRPKLWLVAATLIVVACSDARPYVAAVDALSLPATWEVVKTDVASGMGFCANCPHVTRYYLAPGEMPALLVQIEQVIRQAGYTDVRASDPAFDRNGNGALCTVTSRNERFLLIAGVYRPGDDVDHLGLSRADIPMVRITAQAS
jgi:hypothetical protein